MRFIIDECIGPAVAHWMRAQGLEVFSVFEEARGWDDNRILAKAESGGWVLITGDKDFGELIFRERRPHHGVVLMRLDDERRANKVTVLERLLAAYARQLDDAFVVVSETRVRFARI
jgi:predicted nuclease of predicted toxin-antitoxin system